MQVSHNKSKILAISKLTLTLKKIIKRSYTKTLEDHTYLSFEQACSLGCRFV